jgi:hypothetical protein
VTPSVSSQGAPAASDEAKGITETGPTVCTPVCTGEPKPEQSSTLEVLAAALLNLSPAERARLAAMLLSGPSGGPGPGLDGSS